MAEARACTAAPKAGERARLALRRTWRLEATAAEIEPSLRILADMPLKAEPPATVERLAAAGADLQHAKCFLDRLRERVGEGEIPLGGHREDALLDDVAERVRGIVSGIEAHLGAYPEPEPAWEESGVRETFLLEIEEERARDCRWLLQRALEASDAPAPEELLGRAYLRAVADDLDELDAYLVELAAGESNDELREVIVRAQEEARAVVDAISTGLPPLGAAEEA